MVGALYDVPDECDNNLPKDYESNAQFSESFEFIVYCPILTLMLTHGGKINCGPIENYV